jgi:hypothetical protein
MDDRTKNLKGSESRDQFKQLHKTELYSNFYATDIDLGLVEKHPVPFIVACCDFKRHGDLITFAEVIAYNQLVNAPPPWRIPVYIIEATTSFVNEESEYHKFNIYEYIQGDPYPDPPVVTKRLLKESLSWDELKEWEWTLRMTRRKEFMAARQGRVNIN